MRKTLPLLASLALCSMPTIAAADFHWPANSTVPLHLQVVAMHDGIPDRDAGRFDVIVRDLANNPVDGVWVTLDFGAIPELQLAADPRDPEEAVNCAARTVRRLTSPAGVASFTVLGCGSNRTAQPSLLVAKVWAADVLLGTTHVSLLDFDCANGAGANDFGLWLGDFGTGLLYGRGDWDGSGVLGANDLSVWLEAFGRGNSAESASPFCP
jgi:hypothetical protein